MSEFEQSIGQNGPSGGEHDSRRAPASRSSHLGRALLRWFVAYVVWFLFQLLWHFPALDRITATIVLFLVRLLNPSLHHRMLDNLRLVYGRQMTPEQRRQLAERVWANESATFIEFIHGRRLSPHEVRRVTVFRGLRRLGQATAGGHGVIVLTGHFGNFEWLGMALASFGLPAAAIARANRSVAEQVVAEVRETHGLEIVYDTDWRRAISLLKQGVSVGIVADQAVRRGGIMAEFLGQQATTPLGPFILARFGNAPLIPVFITRDANGRHIIEAHPALEMPRTRDRDADFRAAAQTMNDHFSAQIHSRPEQWHWLHRRFKPPLSLHGEKGDL
ncbi:MAG: hypothetical protein HZB16_03240 [Armatimonadetes bacterium]|nr:hypothetical protein [Armatimonadota bacterium]